MYSDAIEAIKNSSKDSSVYIGSDSKRFKRDGVWYARYSTVIILHIDSCRGCKVFSYDEIVRDYGGLKQRLMNEVQYAIMAATAVIEHIGERKLEIHLDLNSNPKHKSNIAVSEAIGWVRGSTGITPKIKPTSFAASHCSDHVVRGKMIKGSAISSLH